MREPKQFQETRAPGLKNEHNRLVPNEGSNDSDIYIDEVVLCKEITEIRNHTETGPNFTDETKQKWTNWNNETLLDEIKTHNHYQ